MNTQVPTFEVTSDDKLWAALAYVLSPLVPIIILLMQDKKARPFIRAHNVQALVVGIVVSILAAVLTAICIGPFLWLVMLYLAFKAYQGNTFEIPVITNFVKQQGWA
jgi:uncharacterized membrane protein